MRTILTVLLIAACTTVTLGQAINMTGDVVQDFDRGQYIYDSVHGCDVALPAPLVGRACGWDIVGVAVSYDHVWDVMYLGIDIAGIAGDADGDGDPATTGPVLQGLGGVDHPDFGGTESIVVGMDLTSDGIIDIVAGIPMGGDIRAACCADYVPGAPDIRQAFGALRPINAPEMVGGGSAQQPDVELAIPGFSWLSFEFMRAGQQDIGFYAWAGSDDDATIGFDATTDDGTTIPHPIIMLPCFPLDNQFEFLGVEVHAMPPANEVTFRYGIRDNYGCCILYSFFQNPMGETINIPGNPTILVGQPGLLDLGFIDLGVPPTSMQPVDCKDTSLFFPASSLMIGQMLFLQVVSYPGTGAITTDFLASNVLTYIHF